jgi:broad specificity phosphatase PhoE
MMQRIRTWSALLALALAAAAAPAADDGQLVEALRAGGFNIYFRHAQTDWSQSDRVHAAGDWTSCDGSRIRQLSQEGRETARQVGEDMRALGVPVGRVLASPYCRTVETARLLDVGPVEPTTDVMNLRVAEYFGGRGRIVESARALLARAPGPGTNTVIVAHGNVARNATPVYPGEAEGVVFRPDGEGGFTLVSRLPPDEWRRLAERFAPAQAASPATTR